jgi:hypothetical protein
LCNIQGNETKRRKRRRRRRRRRGGGQGETGEVVDIAVARRMRTRGVSRSRIKKRKILAHSCANLSWCEREEN